MKKTPLNKVSKKQSKRLKEYKQARKKHYAEEANQACAICGSRDSLSIHHKSGRGTNTANKNTFVTLCILGNTFDLLYPELNSCNGGGCHSGIESNHNWARENGYLT